MLSTRALSSPPFLGLIMNYFLPPITLFFFKGGRDQFLIIIRIIYTDEKHNVLGLLKSFEIFPHNDKPDVLRNLISLYFASGKCVCQSFSLEIISII